MGTVVPGGIIDGIYDAALDRTLWLEALARIGAQFGGAPTQLGVWDLENGTIPLGIGADFAPGIREIASRFATPETNPMLRVAMEIPLHKAVDQAEALGIDYFRSLEIYSALYRPQGHMPMFGTVVVRSGVAFGGLALMRPPHWDLASAEDLALGERISRHVGRSVELSGLFGTQDDKPGSFEAALYQVQTPILLLTDERRVAWANPAAEELLQAQDGLARRRRKLVATDLDGNARLSQAFVSAMQGSDAVLSVRGKRRSAMLIVRLSPLWRTYARSGARVLVQVALPRARVRLDAEEAAGLFQLSPAEARVACELCSGARNLAEVGAALNITVNTVKTLLQRVYNKTGVHSQTELVALFSSALRPDPTIRK